MTQVCKVFPLPDESIVSPTQWMFQRKRAHHEAYASAPRTQRGAAVGSFSDAVLCR
jgi:hypothetical protein